MKPDNWSSLDPQEKAEIASQLMNSMRGRLLLTQAMTIATRVMREKVPPMLVEESNCQDMEMLIETFGLPPAMCVQSATEAFLNISDPVSMKDVEAMNMVHMEDGPGAAVVKPHPEAVE